MNWTFYEPIKHVNSISETCTAFNVIRGERLPIFTESLPFPGCTAISSNYSENQGRVSGALSPCKQKRTRRPEMMAIKTRDRLAEGTKGKIQTAVLPATPFYLAETYHIVRQPTHRRGRLPHIRQLPYRDAKHQSPANPADGGVGD